MPEPDAQPERPYASRGGLKLEHALDAFDLDVTGRRCVDLGASTGGFTDCLLRRGAERVVAVDTAYGALDYRLRQHLQVTVLERTNALHLEPPEELRGADLVVMDLGWTPQRLAVPAALKWLAPDPAARIITLIKSQYEARDVGLEALLERGVLDEPSSRRIAAATLDHMPEWGAVPLAFTRSPIAGGGSRRRKPGNIEWLALLAASPSAGGGQ